MGLISGHCGLWLFDQLATRVFARFGSNHAASSAGAVLDLPELFGQGGESWRSSLPASWPELSNTISSTVFCLVKAVQKRQSSRGPHDYRPRCETSWPGPRRGEGNMAADSGFLIGWRMGNGKFSLAPYSIPPKRSSNHLELSLREGGERLDRKRPQRGRFVRFGFSAVKPHCETSRPGPRRGEGNVAADSGFLIGWRMGNSKVFWHHIQFHQKDLLTTLHCH